MGFKKITFENKENINTNSEIPRINKIIDDDINEIKDVVNTNVESLESILNELQYNLIPNTESIKTGRKINGKEEWVKLVTYNSTLSAGMNKTSVNGLPANANMHEYSVVIKPQNGNDVVVKDGFFHSSTDFFAAHGYKNGNIQLMIGSAAQWVNNNLKCYMTLYYTLDNEES